MIMNILFLAQTVQMGGIDRKFDGSFGTEFITKQNGSD
jgi:hypothetical protein